MAHFTLAPQVTCAAAFTSQNNVIDGFTKQYRVHRLVWFESHCEVHAAIRREKCIKNWPRAWKPYLIEAMNPYWDDLFDTLQ